MLFKFPIINGEYWINKVGVLKKFVTEEILKKKEIFMKHQFLTKLIFLFIVIQKGITIENSIIFTIHLY